MSSRSQLVATPFPQVYTFRTCVIYRSAPLVPCRTTTSSHAVSGIVSSKFLTSADCPSHLYAEGLRPLIPVASGTLINGACSYTRSLRSEEHTSELQSPMY